MKKIIYLWDPTGLYR